MTTIVNLQQLKNEIVSRLGSPVITIEVTPNQVERCIDRAIAMFVEKHPDGTNITYGLHKVTATEAATQIINFREMPITSIQSISTAPSDLMQGWYEGAIFDSQWHLAADIVKNLGMFGGVWGTNDFTHLEAWHQYYETAKRYFAPDSDFHYNEATRQLRIYSSKLFTDQILLIEAVTAAVIKIDKSKIADTSALKDLNNYSCSIDPLVNTTEPLCITAGGLWQVSQQDFYNPESSTEVVLNAPVPDPDPTYISQLAFDNRWFLDYVTALVKYQWGQNTGKYASLELMGGVKMDGAAIKAEAKEELKELMDELHTLEAPIQFWLG